MNGQGATQRVQEWLSSTWHVQVPYAWLEACVSWVVQEGAGAPVLQAQVNQQVLEQWLLTDLRSLVHPVLPVQLGQAPKTELSGCFCLQVDSLLDISRPAYSQLQQWRGLDCGNEQVSTVTQVSQRAWEATPTRVLMLQLTDGVQNMQALEYQPIPALSASLPPGTKLLLQGAMECRLGVLLLRPGNVRVLGGEVEELQATNSQGRVLCRVLGLPEDSLQEGRAQGADPQPGYEGMSDEELLASLEAVAVDSGYGSRSEVLNGSHPGIERPLSLITPSPTTDGPVNAGNLNEDFEDIPLDELDSIIFQEEPDPSVEEGHPPIEVGAGSETVEAGSGVGSPCGEVGIGMEHRDEATEGAPKSRAAVVPPSAGGLGRSVEEMPRTLLEPSSHRSASGSGPGSSGGTGELWGTRTQGDPAVRGLRLAVGTEWSTRPFTYLCALRRDGQGGAREVQVKAFIMTLLGSLQSSSGAWQVSATISDGSGYLDVRLSDGLLAGLIRFSVAESRAMRKDPEQRPAVIAGLQRCQRELVDMCCLMTLRYDPVTETGEVLCAQEVTADNCRDLESRVRSRTRVAELRPFH